MCIRDRMTDGLGWEENLIEMGLDRRDAQGRLAPVYHLSLIHIW